MTLRPGSAVGASDPDHTERCQHGVRTKAFKGKGAAAKQVRTAQVQVDAIHARMREVSATTRSIKGRVFYLAVHARTGTGQLSLRWRKAGASRRTHLTWDAMPALFDQLPHVLAEWYRAADRLARDMNREEQAARVLLRQAQADLAFEQKQLMPDQR